MLGYVEGYSDTDIINYCPACGAEVGNYHVDRTATCKECGERFAVITYYEENKDK